MLFIHDADVSVDVGNDTLIVVEAVSHVVFVFDSVSLVLPYQYETKTVLDEICNSWIKVHIIKCVPIKISKYVYSQMFSVPPGNLQFTRNFEFEVLLLMSISFEEFENHTIQFAPWPLSCFIRHQSWHLALKSYFRKYIK